MNKQFFTLKNKTFEMDIKDESILDELNMSLSDLFSFIDTHVDIGDIGERYEIFLGKFNAVGESKAFGIHEEFTYTQSVKMVIRDGDDVDYNISFIF